MLKSNLTNIDSDIILDLLAKREPHYIHAAKLFTLIDQEKIKAFTSPIIFANIHYLLKKLSSSKSAMQNLRKLKILVNVLPIDDRVIEQSLNSDFGDFEDAIQYYTAINNGIKILLKRNKSDYRKAKLIIASAEEFLNPWNSKKKK